MMGRNKNLSFDTVEQEIRKREAIRENVALVKNEIQRLLKEEEETYEKSSIITRSQLMEMSLLKGDKASSNGASNNNNSLLEPTNVRNVSLPPRPPLAINKVENQRNYRTADPVRSETWSCSTLTDDNSSKASKCVHVSQMAL
jgi:hypothetical protein